MTLNFFDDREPPQNRRGYCEGDKERHLTEGAVMLAFAVYLLEHGATAVELHPDGEHGKRFDFRASLEAREFLLVTAQGTTSYGGIYKRGVQQVTVTLTPGMGDVVADVNAQTVVAECKGGVINTRHAGQLSKLRRGLCEAVGLLMARPLNGERHIAVVPATATTTKLAQRMLTRATAAGIEITLVDETGKVVFVEDVPSQSAVSDRQK